jgi:hypothetical protein
LANKINPGGAANKHQGLRPLYHDLRDWGMATTPLSGVLSPAQIAVLQQARAALARSIAVPAQPEAAPSSGKAAESLAPPTPRGRGQIVNIVV